MKIKLENGTPASEDEIVAFESALGTQLSASFLAFLRTQNGAEPENNFLRGNKDVSVSGFIPLAEIMDERSYIENIPEKGYPIALSAGGNYVFIDEANTTVL